MSEYRFEFPELPPASADQESVYREASLIVVALKGRCEACDAPLTVTVDLGQLAVAIGGWKKEEEAR